MRITLIVGLPGSGKTHFAKTLIKERGGILVDDPRELDELPVAADHLVITDPYFCFEEICLAACEILYKKYGEPVIDFIFFENDPEQALQNATGRDRAVTSFIQQCSDAYKIPEGVVAIPVWKNAQA